MNPWAAWIPPWLQEWAQQYLLPFLKIQLRQLLWVFLQGVLETFLLFALPTAAVLGSQKVWEGRYRLTPAQQETVARWAQVADAVAQLEDVPSVTPLVLWYKEGGLRAVNPDNCEGIMGLHTAVRSGRLPCFPPGPIDDAEVVRQLRLGARIFKEHCPEVHYTTTDPETLKRCYLYYNAGRNTRLDPDRSGYVMNGYDAAHQNMLHRSASGQVVRLQALGAWPVHLAIQAQLNWNPFPGLPSPFLPVVRLLQEGWDRLWAWAAPPTWVHPRPAAAVSCFAPAVGECFVAPHQGGDADLAPILRPDAPVRWVGEVACGVFPGVAMATGQAALLPVPMPGRLARYTDQWGQLTLQVENDEWILWISGLRSAVTERGEVRAGEPLGTLGGGKEHPFYVALYDKVAGGYVDPRPFLAQSLCPEVDATIQRNLLVEEEGMNNLAALLPFVPLILGLVWALWLFFKKDMLAKGPVQVITYFIGVILALWIIGWIVDAFLPQWVAQRLVNARQSQDIRTIQQVSREILNEAAGRAPTPVVVVYTPAPVVPTPVPPTPVPVVPSPVSPEATPPQGSVAPTVPVFSAQAAPGPGEQVYVVRSGDALFSIARRFGVSLQALQQRNNIVNPNDIKVGQQLIIPAP
ncbi:MAG: LysM peptidoglycan-binding domain-containing protein [Thermoflexales bacterium]|nr:LysM peptidoglycan-binding domain-containing protein [Thermoflexales bacterium]